MFFARVFPQVLEQLERRYSDSECSSANVPPKAELRTGTAEAVPFGGLELMEQGLRGSDVEAASADTHTSRDKLDTT